MFHLKILASFQKLQDQLKHSLDFFYFKEEKEYSFPGTWIKMRNQLKDTV